MVGTPNNMNDPELIEVMKKEVGGQLQTKAKHVADNIPLSNTIIIPRITMLSEKDENKDTFTIIYNDTEKSKKLDDQNHQIKSEYPVGSISPGNGSLSSGCSVITISSAANSDPDPESTSNGNSPTGRTVLEEKWQHTALQVSVPFFIAGVGTIGAGLVLDTVEKWPVFQEISQLLILVPSLLGLKGNLDMCLASRLCTQANLGNMNGCREIMKMIIGNLALVQIQAIVAAIIVAIFATSAHAIMSGIFVWDHTLLVIASSICTATSSCFVLDLVMIAVIMLTHRWKMNPDNLATPLAASFGDVVSISVFSFIASSLFRRMIDEMWIMYVIICGFLLVLPIWIWIVLKNKYTRNVLTSGWVPVLSALFISGLGGLFLSNAVEKYEGFGVFSPIINGIGGNLVSVQASRISTTLHQTSIKGIIPPYTKILVTPWKALLKGVPFAKTARLLITMGIFGELVFIFAADYFKNYESSLEIYFILAYIFISTIQITLLLYVAHIMIHAMWRYKIDPDNSAIPYLTALGDLSGTVLLAGAFWLLYTIGHPYGTNKNAT